MSLFSMGAVRMKQNPLTYLFRTSSFKFYIQASFHESGCHPKHWHIDTLNVVTHGLHFPATIALITQLSPITHCTDYTAECHQTLFISLGLPLSHGRVLFCPADISERYPVSITCCLPDLITHSDCLPPALDPACLAFTLSPVCRLPLTPPALRLLYHLSAACPWPRLPCVYSLTCLPPALDPACLAFTLSPVYRLPLTPPALRLLYHLSAACPWPRLPCVYSITCLPPALDPACLAFTLSPVCRLPLTPPALRLLYHLSAACPWPRLPCVYSITCLPPASTLCLLSVYDSVSLRYPWRCYQNCACLTRCTSNKTAHGSQRHWLYVTLAIQYILKSYLKASGMQFLKLFLKCLLHGFKKMIR